MRTIIEMRSDKSHTRHEMPDDIFEVMSRGLSNVGIRLKMTPSKLIGLLPRHLARQITTTEIAAPEIKRESPHAVFVDEMIDQQELNELMRKRRPSISSPVRPRHWVYETFLKHRTS